MAGKIATKTFVGGMNKDIDISLLKQDQYIHAENFKLVADDDSNGFVLENAEGNSIWFDASDWGIDDTHYLIGQCFIKPYLVLFYTTNARTTSPWGGDTKIMRLLLDGDELIERKIIFQQATSANGWLDLSTTYPINAVGYYESPDNIKVYWTDGYHPVRVINIMDPLLSTYHAGMFDIVPDFPTNSSVQIRPTIDSTLINGELEACSVQYAYQYFIKNGVQTLWSPASAIQVIPENGNQLLYGEYKGGDEDTTTGYGVSVEIGVPSENLYSHMRIVALQYNSYNATPEIRIIEETPLDVGTGYTLTVTDTGGSIGEISYEEFVVSNNAQYKAKDLAIKDNRLFLANINEDFYDVEDFDCRAYRYNSAGLSRVYESDLSTYLNVTSYSTVPEDHDCINLYNDPDTEYTSQYKFTSGGTVIGAEGENITVTCDPNSVLLDDTGTSNSSTSNVNITIANTSPYLHQAGKKSWARQEVYRLGIVFRNEKMQASPVKWICDFKMPSYEDVDFGFGTGNFKTLYTSGNNSYARMLSLQVEMSNFSSTGATSWEVVYVPRESGDRGVLSQGLLQATNEEDSGSYYSPIQIVTREDTSTTLGTWDGATILISPEVAYNKNLEWRSGDFYQKIGYFVYDNNVISDHSITPPDERFKHCKLTSFEEEGDYSSAWKWEISSGQIISYDNNPDNRYNLATETVTGYSSDELSSEIGIASTFFASDHASAASSSFIDTTAAGQLKIPVVNYRRNVFSSQYGGPTYLNRQYNSYIPASALAQTDTTITTYEGDTYIDYFSHLKQSIDLSLDPTSYTTEGSTFLFPVESSISPRLSHSDYLYRHLSSERHRLVQEIAGTHEGEINSTNYVYEQELPLYEYNTVYSQSSRSNLYPADSTDFDVTSKYPTRILNSEYKSNNEELDSFTQFKPNNFLDVDGSKGQLENVKTFDNKLFFWQDTGFGIASVNRQSLIQDNNPGVLALGTGGILDRFDYISEHVGNQNQYGIVLSRKAIYWFDNNKREFFKYSNGVNSISKIKGIQTWLNSIGHIGDVHAVFDEKYNDVIFSLTRARTGTVSLTSGDNIAEYTMDITGGIYTTGDVTVRVPSDDEDTRPYRHVVTHTGSGVFTIEPPPYGDSGGNFYITYDHDNDRKYTLTYNEIVDRFVSYNSFTPRLYLQTDAAYYSCNDSRDLWRHNDKDADKVSYYGWVYDSIVTTSFNDNFPYTKTWDALKWVSESVDDDDINIFDDTFTSVEIYNDYQNTGERTLVFGATPTTGETEIARRERTWSMSIPRNIVNDDVSDNVDIHDTANHDETQTFKERMRDKYLTCKFTYDNYDSGNTFSIPFISSIYRQSIR